MSVTTESRLLWIARDIKLSHSVFALPFALLATFVAAGGYPGHTQCLLIVIAMFIARTYAMLTNRYFDRDIDAANPRTAGRALPSGRLKPRDVLLAIVGTAAGLASSGSGRMA
jgi:4-hydroxybenzoate polyprenyltransferase